MGSTEAIGGVLVAVVLIAAVMFVMPRLMGGNRMTCNRCDGTGQINERWPDPKEASGFHEARGTCPKCKGKGTVKV
jgi:hypothetical protein